MLGVASEFKRAEVRPPELNGISSSSAQKESFVVPHDLSVNEGCEVTDDLQTILAYLN